MRRPRIEDCAAVAVITFNLFAAWVFARQGMYLAACVSGLAAGVWILLPMAWR